MDRLHLLVAPIIMGSGRSGLELVAHRSARRRAAPACPSASPGRGRRAVRLRFFSVSSATTGADGSLQRPSNIRRSRRRCIGRWRSSSSASFPSARSWPIFSRARSRHRLFVIHGSFGVVVFTLMLLRAVTRWRSRPAPYPGLQPWELRLSTGVHHALYGLLLITPVIGWLALSAYGLGPSFFGLGECRASCPRTNPCPKILLPYTRHSPSPSPAS